MTPAPLPDPLLRDRIRGVLLGTAVGDSLGLPAEGISRRRVRKLFRGPWRHRFLPGRGMLSDDTEHTLFVAQSLLASSGDPDAFARRLAWCLRGWLLALPAGMGLATLRATLKLWLGFPPSRSGVRSAGNGPAMRAAPIGAFFGARSAMEAPNRLPLPPGGLAHAYVFGAGGPSSMDPFLEASARITHTDPRALTGSAAVAHLTAWSMERAPGEHPAMDLVAERLRELDREDREWVDLVDAISDAHRRGASVEAFADELGLRKGVSGYVYHTVPVAIYAWLRHFGDFEATLSSVLDLGGDTDSVGAVAGALAGAVTGESGIPETWIDGIVEVPRSVPVLRRVAARMTVTASREDEPGPVGYFWPGIVPRNLLFLAVVLLHGFRRLLPPY